jgi:hypothetical protein
MRKFIAFSAAVAVGLLALPSVAAPQLPEKPRWEYAELSYRAGRPGGRGPDETEVPALASVIRWTTGEGEIEAKSWTELGEKLKAPPFKKDASVTLQRIQLLNHLGGEGWEMVGQQGTTTAASFAPRADGGRPSQTLTGSGTWTFKRRAR